MSLRREVSLPLPPLGCRGALQISVGTRVELAGFKDALMASKGDTILVVPGWFIILTNMPWQRFIEGFRALNGKAQRVTSVKLTVDVIKVNEERHYALARLVEGVVEAEFTRTEENEDVLESGRDARVIEGVEFRVSKIARHKHQVSGKATLKLTGDGWRIYEEVTERSKISTGIENGVEWRIVGEGRLSKILNEYIEISRSSSRRFLGQATIYTEHGIAKVYVNTATGSITADISDIGLPSEEKLLECSRFYSIIVPRIFMCNIEDDVRYYAEFDVYYNGAKRTLVFNYDPPISIWFRFLRRRSISSYARRVLPRGYESARDIVRKVGASDTFFYDVIYNPSSKNVSSVLAEFNMFADEVYTRVQKLRSKPRNIDRLDGFFESLYARIPRRKLRVIREWVELYERVKDLASKTTLYIVFYGRRTRRRVPNFVGFRIDGNGSISILSRRVVPVSGISFRGGEFERLYRDVMNLDNLIFYQLARNDEKLVILRDWVEDVRGRLRSIGVEPATAPFNEVVGKVRELSLADALTDNGVYLVFQFMENLKGRMSGDVMKRVDALARILIGLIKTGKYPEDYEKFAEAGFLEPMRWVIKYSIKSRGYSIKKGVLILGNPAGVRRKIKEVIQRMQGRMLALAEAIEAAELPKEYKPIIEVGKRLEAIAKLI